MSQASRGFFVGIDLGGTNTKIGLVTEEGELLISESFPTRVERGHEAIIDEMAERARGLWQRENIPAERVVAVGVGSPGPLDPKTGLVLVTPNLKWKDVPLRDLLLDRLQTPVVVDNDAVAATFGEWWVGAGRPYRDVVGLTLGTGVGGGIVLDGHIHHGFLGTGGHIGHMIVQAGGHLCGCGNQGCLEAYGSATAIARLAGKLIDEGTASLLQQMEKPLSGKKVYQAAVKGDALARRVFDETAFYLAVGINNVLNIVNPEAVVVMGAVAGAGDHLFGPLTRHLEKLAFQRVYEATSILPGSLGENAGIVGAAGVARQRRHEYE